MEKIIQLQRKIAPEFTAVIESRYNILRCIQYAEPVGRRALAMMLNTGERVVRAQVEFLKDAGLVDVSQLGMTVTVEGKVVLAELADYIRLLRGLVGLEEEMTQALHLKRVIILPGDSEADSAVQRELGRVTAGVVGQCLGDNMTIAVSGGSTMASVAEAVNFSAPSTTVVPARGGLGEKVEYQANTIAAVMAGKLGGRYRLLHIPDGVSEEALEVILADDANVRVVAEIIRQADILVHGIGQAAEMAKQRGLSANIVDELVRRGAVGEALGQYYTIEGNIVYVTSSIGLHLDDLAGIRTVIAVAGGGKKAQAIMAVASTGSHDVLITDEAAARAIQQIINNNDRGNF
ncbi:MAG TPA: sugar-binding domain-containing protein [Methylomusa anaerophila]|uniref:Central glycolytic genes regulator n=1 Tax=Methylomusa anaerophila TaxID=1930071 RepID=A0A348AL18_9FIRM|nr:sugar-binding domain-containing protein [Methylomusa anaerophila]BBB91766.1 central glycolytic genes regulator [Methylomusa anaerophila]HML88497.1 sugar-binding domain-containing protein [Methylomusa anaerophila]